MFCELPRRFESACPPVRCAPPVEHGEAMFTFKLTHQTRKYTQFCCCNRSSLIQDKRECGGRPVTCSAHRRAYRGTHNARSAGGVALGPAERALRAADSGTHWHLKRAARNNRRVDRSPRPLLPGRCRPAFDARRRQLQVPPDCSPEQNHLHLRKGSIGAPSSGGATFHCVAVIVPQQWQPIPWMFSTGSAAGRPRGMPVARRGMRPI